MAENGHGQDIGKLCQNVAPNASAKAHQGAGAPRVWAHIGVIAPEGLRAFAPLRRAQWLRWR